MRTITACLFVVLVVFSLPVKAQELQRASVEREAIGVLDAFMSAFNGRDPVALAETYHFPHYRLARGVMSFLETKGAAVQAHVDTYRVLPGSGWHRSEWVQRRIDVVGESKVHVSTRFKRLREDGSEIGTYDSLYIIIKVDGVWGIKMRSSFL